MEKPKDFIFESEEERIKEENEVNITFRDIYKKYK